MTQHYPTGPGDDKRIPLEVPQNVPQSRSSVCYVTYGEGPQAGKPSAVDRPAYGDHPTSLRALGTRGRPSAAQRPAPMPILRKFGDTLDRSHPAAEALPGRVDRCTWPRPGMPVGAFLENGRAWGACNCECGCRRAEGKYLRCERCGRGRHAIAQPAPVIPLAVRAAMAFAEPAWGFRPPAPTAADALRGRLDAHLRTMQGPQGGHEGSHATTNNDDRTGGASIRRVAAN